MEGQTDGKMDRRQHRGAVRGADKEPVVCANALLSVVLIGGAVRGADADLCGAGPALSVVLTRCYPRCWPSAVRVTVVLTWCCPWC